MIWPSPKDFNDAVRNPAAAFTDPDLAAGDVVLDSNGRPERHPGDSSVVYQVCAEDGRGWAVKCFARIDDQRAARYAAIRAALGAAAPFAAGFEYLEAGIRVGGRVWPVLKMDWVEGEPLNRVLKERADSPAVMDRLFKRWVDLARELRAANLAHGDLQHASALLVPGNWPGAYTLKLIDYDAAHLPALADAPSFETGHPNYRHPDRNERSYSPDLDRFPLLVIGTALKALSVLGPRLWAEYGAADNVLFTASDFASPSGSRLMRELWTCDSAAVRALVGKLALACTRPLALTPWLDDLAPDGADPTLSEEEARAVAALLGARADVPLTAAFTLDDEHQPAPNRPAAFSLDDAEPVPARPKAKKPLTPVPVVTDEDDEDDRPARRGRRREEPARGFPLVALAVVAGLVMLAGAGAAGVLVYRAYQSQEVADTRPNEPETKPDPKPPQPEPKPPEPAPAPPEAKPQPEPKPPEPPPFAGPPGFYPRWAKLVADEKANVKVYIAPDGGAVYVAINGKIDAFDAKTGAPRPALRGAGLPTVALHVWPLDRDRVAVFGFPLKVPGLWDAKTGEELPPLVRDLLPPPPPGTNESAVEAQLSPDGRYVFAGYQGPLRGAGHGPAPYRLVETATGKVIAQGDWTFGTVRFTADGSRVLVTETNGRVRWVRTATGEVENEWAFDPNGYPRMIGGMSDDGSLFVYFGKPPGLGFDHYLIDGKTGQVLRRLGVSYNGERGVLSADGRWLASVVPDAPQFRQVSAVIADARTGEVLVRTPLDGGPNDYQRAAFTPDGKALVVHSRAAHEIAVYEFRGKVPAPQTAAAPAPLTPVPPRAPPVVAGGPAVPPPFPPPPVPFPPKGALPDAPALKAVWTVPADVQPTTNQLSQAPLYSKDGKTVLLSGGLAGTVLTFDAKTGAAGTAYDGLKGAGGGVAWVFPVGNDRAAVGGFAAKSTALWDTKTGKRVDEVTFPELPPLPAGKGHAGLTHVVSPTGRYTVAARREVAVPGGGPLRVLDTTTGKEVVSGSWGNGHVAFTADESRVLVLDGLGRATWYKLPSGEPDGEWRTSELRQSLRVLGMTADGRTLLVHGPLADEPIGVYLLDAKTGKVVRRINPGVPYQPAMSALSPDGRHVAMLVIDFARGAVAHVDVFAVDDWRLVGRASPPDKGGRESPQFSFAPDGKSLGVFYRRGREVSLFALPGG